MAERVRRCQDDHRAARSPDPSLRYRRNRKRQLAIQKPNLTTASRSLATALLGGALARGLLHPAHASPPLKSMADGGQSCTPIGGQFWKPIDIFPCLTVFGALVMVPTVIIAIQPDRDSTTASGYNFCAPTRR